MSKEIKELLLKESENYKDRLINLVSKLTQFDSYIGDEKEILHHVLVGGYKNQKRANNVSGKLSEQGIPHIIIQP